MFSCKIIGFFSLFFPAPLFPFYPSASSMFAKFSIAASFAVIYIHSGEIFPTSIRNSAMGLVSVAARAGGNFLT